MILKVRTNLLIKTFIQTANTCFKLLIFQQFLHFIFSLHFCIVVDFFVSTEIELLKQTSFPLARKGSQIEGNSAS